MPAGCRTQNPRRNPLACGALGRYDPALVAEIGRRLAGEMSAVHEDGGSVLLLDRPAIRWGARRTQGFAWSEGRPAERSVASWKDAACELAACGLVAHGERRRVHSSVSGVAPIYYVEHAGAVYFASRIDPLVQALPRRYTIDWRAWASIFYLRFPIGERTPFREVKRLRPVQHPGMGCGPPGGEGAAASLAVGRGPAEPRPRRGRRRARRGNAGGRRAPCARARLLHAQRWLGLPAPALPAGRARARRPSGRDGEPGQRPPPRGGARGEVATSLGVPHSILEGDPAAFWDDTRERALRVDFQLAAPPWAMPLAAALRGRPGVATDGLGLDTLAQGGTHYYTESMIRPDGTPAGARSCGLAFSARSCGMRPGARCRGSSTTT